MPLYLMLTTLNITLKWSITYKNSQSQRSVEKNTYVKVENNLNYRLQKFERKAVADFWTCGWSFAKRDSDTKKLGTFGETNVLDSG